MSTSMCCSCCPAAMAPPRLAPFSFSSLARLPLTTTAAAPGGVRLLDAAPARRPPRLVSDRRPPPPRAAYANTTTSNSKRSRRRAQEEAALDDAASPSDAARGFCRRCGVTHGLRRTARAEAEARALMRRIRDAGRLDFDADPPGDPRFSASNLYRPNGGKMLGVLVASARMGGGDGGPAEHDVVVLKAFSGQLWGEWSVPGWAPPLCGLTHTHPHYVRQHARIRALVDAAAERRAAVEELEAEVRREERTWDRKIELLSARLGEARRARRERRRAAAAAAGEATEGSVGLRRGRVADDAGLEEQLAEESRRGKREVARLREEREAAIAEPRAAAAAARDEMNRLRAEHRSMSHVLLGEIFESYRLPNFRNSNAPKACGEPTGDDDFSGGMSGAKLRDVFVSEEMEASAGRGSGAVGDEVNLRSGCGDCCAPKLLAECARRGLTPLGIAEVWMGTSTKREGHRVEGNFYAACRGRCRPIMGHMLCGADELQALLPSTERKLIEIPNR